MLQLCFLLLISSQIPVWLENFSCVWFFVTPWTVVHQVPLSLGFSRQEYWNGLPFSPPEDFPHPGTEPTSHVSCIGRRVLFFFFGRRVLYHQCHLERPNIGWTRSETRVCNRTWWTFHFRSRTLCPLNSNSPLPPVSLFPGNHHSIFCLFKYLAPLKTSYKWNCTRFVFSWLAYFT